MANCSNCSAPLPADTSRCSYCGTRNDMDLAGIGRFAVSREGSGRKCPYCDIPLQTIRLGDNVFAIERCESCFGLFFDPGELQAFLETSVAKAYEVDFRQIVNIDRERGGKKIRQVRYIKCPECGKFMNRVNFGYKSGVVMDQCRQHGVWLDNGELIHLMEWKKAGGALLDEQKKAEQAREEEKRRARAAARAGASRTGRIVFDSRRRNSPDDLAGKVLSLLSKFLS